MIYTKNLENNQNKLGHCFKWMWCIISKLFAIELKKKKYDTNFLFSYI